MAKQDFFVNEFQREIWNDSYRNKIENIEETQWRQVNSIFKNESEELKQDLYNELISKRIVFGGRVTANIGSDLKNVYAFNCYAAQRSVKPVDSMKNIFSDITNSAQILRTEGGIGFDFGHLRPRGTLIKGIGVGSPGVLAFMEIQDKVSEIITRGNPGNIIQGEGLTHKNKIRKGAMLSVLPVCHPEIIDYIEAKRIPNKLTKFNMSVAIDDKFMNAVLKDEDWTLWFPDIKFERYDEEWNGDFQEWEDKGYPIKVYRKMKAKELWDFLIKNCYNRNEPGLFFIDNANRYNNLSYYQRITGCNPCAEILMMADPGVFKYKGVLYEHIGDICNLGSLNLPMFYTKARGFDFTQFKKSIQLLIRALDNIIDISGYPLEGLKNAAFLRRKLGCGSMGWGSLFFMIGDKYGSPSMLKYAIAIQDFYINEAYKTSALLANEKGIFPLYDKEKIFTRGFLKNGTLSEDTLELVKKYGLRNSQLLTIAPTGTTSIYAGMSSGGIEPVFESEYCRWVISNHQINKLLKDLEYPDFLRGEWKETKDFKFFMKGDEQILISRDKSFQIDKNNGLRKKVECEDYGWTWCKQNFTPEELEEKRLKGAFSTATELTVEEHLNPLIELSKRVDLSISKTLNLPHNYNIDDFSKLFIKAWQEGVRGITTYREGTMIAVLEAKKIEELSKKEIKKEQKGFFDIWKKHETDGVVLEDVDLPTEYPMYGYVLKSEGKKWYASIAFKDKGLTRPFAIFVKTNSRDPKIVINNSVQLLNELAIKNGLKEELIKKNLDKIELETNFNKLTRMISFLLRHNVKIYDIIKSLEEIEGITPGHFVYRITKFLYKFVDSIDINGMNCPSCGGKVRLSEGCIGCIECSWVKC